MKKSLAFLLLAVPAHAESITSTYSNFNLGLCKALHIAKEDGDGNQWQCKGIKDFDVIYWEGDLRGTVGFGPQAKSQCVSMQTFNAFNNPGPKVEWRMAGGKPFATIQRWSTDNGEVSAKQDWLVVSKLNGKQACRTAMIDVYLPEPNKIARERADSTRNFNCEKDSPEIVSRVEYSLQDVMSGAPCGPGPFRDQ
jgi:hypothetical protein